MLYRMLTTAPTYFYCYHLFSRIIYVIFVRFVYFKVCVYLVTYLLSHWICMHDFKRKICFYILSYMISMEIIMIYLL